MGFGGSLVALGGSPASSWGQRGTHRQEVTQQGRVAGLSSRRCLASGRLWGPPQGKLQAPEAGWRESSGPWWGWRKGRGRSYLVWEGMGWGVGGVCHRVCAAARRPQGAVWTPIQVLDPLVIPGAPESSRVRPVPPRVTGMGTQTVTTPQMERRRSTGSLMCDLGRHSVLEPQFLHL